MHNFVVKYRGEQINRQTGSNRTTTNGLVWAVKILNHFKRFGIGFNFGSKLRFSNCQHAKLKKKYKSIKK